MNLSEMEELINKYEPFDGWLRLPKEEFMEFKASVKLLAGSGTISIRTSDNPALDLMKMDRTEYDLTIEREGMYLVSKQHLVAVINSFKRKESKHETK